MPELAQAPELYYVFANQNQPVTRHNLELVGSFTSAAWTGAVSDPRFRQKYLAGNVDYLPFVPNPNLDARFLSMYYVTAVGDYAVEFNAELIRSQEFPSAPSRLSAVFAFESFETCKSTASRWGWNLAEVRRFKLISDPLSRVARLNMEIVGLARHATRISSLSPEDIKLIWRHYWSGGGELTMELPTADFGRANFPSGVLWEYLIEGRLDLDRAWTNPFP